MSLITFRQIARTCAVVLALCACSTYASAQTLGAPQVTLLPDNSVIITYSAPTTPPAGTLLVATFNGQPIGPFGIGRSTTVASGVALPAGTYTVQVVWSPTVASPVTTFSVPVIAGGVPGAPTILPAQTSGNTVILSWTPVGNATSYELQVLVGDGGQIVNVPVGNQTSFTVPNAPLGTYVVRVRARNVNGFGPYSGTIVVSLNPVFRVRDLEVTLTWNTNTDIDLHVIEPNGTEVWWRVRRGITAQLDRDNTTGFGPEVVTVDGGAGIPGVYQVFIVHYRGAAPTTSTISVTLGAGTANPRTQIFTRQTPAARADTGYNVAFVDLAGGVIGEVPGTRRVASSDERSDKPQQ